MKVLILATNGTRDIELVSVYDILKAARIPVEIISVSTKQLKMKSGLVIQADKTILEIDIKDVAAIFIPGGDSVKELMENATVELLLKEANDSKRYIASISEGPKVLNKMAILKGKAFTALPGSIKLTDGELVETKNIVVDDNIITAAGPAISAEFALTIVNRLLGEGKAKEMAVKYIFER